MLQQAFVDRHTKKLGMVVAYSENNLHALAVNLLVTMGFLGDGRIYLINQNQPDLFYYAYAVLQDSCYRQTFLSSLIKTQKLRLPKRQHLVNQDYAFDQLVAIGKKLVQLHVDYEQASKYQQVLVNNKSLAQFEQELQQKSFLEQQAFLQVKKMKLDFNKKAKSITLHFNSKITITHIP